MTLAREKKSLSFKHLICVCACAPRLLPGGGVGGGMMCCQSASLVSKQTAARQRSASVCAARRFSSQRNRNKWGEQGSNGPVGPFVQIKQFYFFVLFFFKGPSYVCHTRRPQAPSDRKRRAIIKRLLRFILNVKKFCSARNRSR